LPEHKHGHLLDLQIKHGEGGSDLSNLEPPPDEVRVGMAVVFHMPSNFPLDPETNAHRVAIVNKVYVRTHESDTGDANEAAIDLTVFLQTDDDPGRNCTNMRVVDAGYDPDCPPGTFCLDTDSDGDELPSVGDLPKATPLTEAK